MLSSDYRVRFPPPFCTIFPSSKNPPENYLNPVTLFYRRFYVVLQLSQISFATLGKPPNNDPLPDLELSTQLARLIGLDPDSKPDNKNQFGANYTGLCKSYQAHWKSGNAPNQLVVYFKKSNLPKTVFKNFNKRRLHLRRSKNYFGTLKIWPFWSLV